MGTMLTFRNDPVILDVKRALSGGALGDIMAVEARQVTSQVRYRDPNFWLFDKSKAGSGILSWLGCHHIDALCYLLDDRVESVSAMVDTKSPFPIDVEDTACLVLRFKSGILGTVHAGYHLVGSASGYSGARYDAFMALRGTEGYVRIPLSERGGYSLNSIAEGWASGGVRDYSFTPPELSRLRRGRGRRVRSTVPPRLTRRQSPCPRAHRGHGPCAGRHRGGHRVLRNRKDGRSRLDVVLDLQLHVTQGEYLTLHDRPHDRAYLDLVLALPERRPVQLVLDDPAVVVHLGETIWELRPLLAAPRPKSPCLRFRMAAERRSPTPRSHLRRRCR